MRAILVVVALSIGTQAPRGSIAGRVVDAATGQPVAGAQLSLIVADTVQSATTDSDGRYVAGNLGSGPYRLLVRAPGYVLREFGDEPPLGYTPVAPRGRSLTNIDIPLHRGATIAGRVVDDAGAPLAAMPVRLFRLSSQSPKQLVPIAGRSMGVSIANDLRGQTDSGGEFRFTAVPAGEYLVGVIDRTVTTFAPGTRAIADAAVISVSGLVERSGVDIRASRPGSGTIRGTVTGAGPAGAGIPIVDVDLVPDPNDAALSPIRAARAPERYGIGADGRFAFADVPAGRYTLFVRPGAVIDAPGVWGRESIVVTPGSVAETTIALEESGRVSGHLTGAAILRVSHHVELAPVASDRAGFRARVVVGADGSFAFKGLAPGMYRWLPSQMLVGSGPRTLTALVDNQDVTDVPLVISPATNIENLRLVVSAAATISGTVRNAAGTTTTAGAVIIASANRRDWTEISRRVRVVRADTDGFFQTRALPAGRYRVAHVTRLPHERPWDEAFLSALRGAIDVTVTAGEIVTVDLRVN